MLKRTCSTFTKFVRTLRFCECLSENVFTIYSPQNLELTGVNEQILIDNLEVFKKNGFTFEINEVAPPTKRVKLCTIPMSKNWILGKEDIEELLFMLRVSINNNNINLPYINILVFFWAPQAHFFIELI